MKATNDDPPHIHLAVLSAALAFHRPTVFSCFVACVLNAGAAYFWWTPLMAHLNGQ
jgi:hypothetical protein